MPFNVNPRNIKIIKFKGDIVQAVYCKYLHNLFDLVYYVLRVFAHKTSLDYR